MGQISLLRMLHLRIQLSKKEQLPAALHRACGPRPKRKNRMSLPARRIGQPLSGLLGLKLLRRKNMKIETIAVHGGYTPDPTTKAVAVPIYQTVA
jgi:hypothetical protein